MSRGKASQTWPNINSYTLDAETPKINNPATMRSSALLSHLRVSTFRSHHGHSPHTEALERTAARTIGTSLSPCAAIPTLIPADEFHL